MNIQGSAAADFLEGDKSDDLITLLAGDDFATGGDGNDTIRGGTGQDTMFGESGSDSLLGEDGEDFLDGGSGNDLLDGGDGDDYLDGGLGSDRILGSVGDDTLDGGEGEDTLLGGKGRDSLTGGPGNDLLDGGDDNDSIEGGDGDDVLVGGSGDDELSGGFGNDNLDGGEGSDLIDQTGTTGNNTIIGGNGNDTLYGGLSGDLIDGGAGDDYLDGGIGNDTLTGGLGNDLVIGGDGIDVVRFSKKSTEYDLEFRADGGISVIGKNSGLMGLTSEGTDQLQEIESIQFANGSLDVQTRQHSSYADLPESLYQFFVVGFGAAPGVTYMDQMAEAYRYWLPQFGSGTVSQIVEAFTTKVQFTSVYPQALYRAEGGAYYKYSHDVTVGSQPLVRGDSVSKEKFDLEMASLAKALINIIVKDSASSQAKVEAENDLRGALALGGEWTIGKVIYTVFGNLANKPEDDPNWAGTARQFLKQTEVARYYTDVLNQSSVDIGVLRSVLAEVNQDSNVSSDEAVVALIGSGLLNGIGP